MKTLKSKPAKKAAVAKKGLVVRGIGAARLKTGKKAPASDILSVVHETVSDFHKSGLVKTETMREFDKLCLEPVVAFKAGEIAALRLREMVSQPVFAQYLNVSKSSVSQWEAGKKNPDGAALKLLNIVRRKGLEVLA